MAPLRRRFSLPPLPSHPQRQVMDQALDRAYRLIRFTSSESHMTLAPFFDEVKELLLQTSDLLQREEYEVKICNVLILTMIKKIGEEEKEEILYFPVQSVHFPT